MHGFGNHFNVTSFFSCKQIFLTDHILYMYFYLYHTYCLQPVQQASINIRYETTVVGTPSMWRLILDFVSLLFATRRHCYARRAIRYAFLVSRMLLSHK